MENDPSYTREVTDRLRAANGACHMAISRNDLSELEREKWDSTELPPRFKKFVEKVITDYLSDPSEEEVVRFMQVHSQETTAHNWGKSRIKLALMDFLDKRRPPSALKNRIENVLKVYGLEGPGNSGLTRDILHALKGEEE